MNDSRSISLLVVVVVGSSSEIGPITSRCFLLCRTRCYMLLLARQLARFSSSRRKYLRFKLDLHRQQLPSSLRLCSTFVMASQRLALNFQRSLRSRQAINAVKSPLLRGYANPVTPSRTESTTLSNGLTVRRSIISTGLFGVLTGCRLRRNIHHGLKPRPWVFGSMPAAEQKQKRPMEQLTSLNIWLSR